MIGVHQNLTVLSRLVFARRLGVKFHKLPHFTHDVTGQHYRPVPSDISLPRLSERRRRLKFRLIGQRSLKWFNSQMLHVFPGYLEFLAIFNLHVFSSFNLFSLKGMFFFLVISNPYYQCFICLNYIIANTSLVLKRIGHKIYY